MSKQTTPEQRREFYRRYVRGETHEAISADSGFSLECVRYWCRKQKKGEGVVSQYHIPKRGALRQFDPRVKKKVLELRESHPRWGAVSLRLNLAKEAELQGLALPSAASIGRYLHEFPQYRRTPKKNSP